MSVSKLYQTGQSTPFLYRYRFNVIHFQSLLKSNPIIKLGNLTDKKNLRKEMDSKKKREPSCFARIK